VGGVIAACIAVFMLRMTPLGPEIALAGAFSSTLLEIGEHWRLVTANLLHAGSWHLVLNLLGMLGLGALVEWPLGTARALLIFIVSGFGAMGASYLAGYEVALGASGVVMGAAGAALYLELFATDWLPAGWRVPRRLFLGALALQVLFEIVARYRFPVFASAAHVGGFASGFVTAALIAARDPRVTSGRPWVYAADALLGALVLLSVAAAARDVVGDPAWFERRAERLLEHESASPIVLNDTAWRLVTDQTDPTRHQLTIALALAERAVEETERSDPNLLDTLAEVRFAAGETASAIATIDEAIALAPRVHYFREQRRRFTGERDRDSRPDPWTWPPWLVPDAPPSDEPPPDDEEDPLVTV
jgi:rhomboid protease GluP